MAKYPMNFANSTYSRLWDSKDGPALLQQVLDDPNLIRANFNFWRTKFYVDNNMTPTDSDGVAAFSTKLRPIQHGQLMDWRAPLGDSYQAEKKNVKAFTGIIPDFIARGTVEKATEREYREEKYKANYGNDASLVLDFASEVQLKFDSFNQTMSHLAAKVLSGGAASYSHGLGYKGSINDSPIPDSNHLKAGTVAWTAENCLLLDQMRDKEKSMKKLTSV